MSEIEEYRETIKDLRKDKERLLEENKELKEKLSDLRNIKRSLNNIVYAIDEKKDIAIDEILNKMLDIVDEYKNENGSKMFPNTEHFKSKGISRHYINKYKISGLKKLYEERRKN